MKYDGISGVMQSVEVLLKPSILFIVNVCDAEMDMV